MFPHDAGTGTERPRTTRFPLNMNLSCLVKLKFTLTSNLHRFAMPQLTNLNSECCCNLQPDGNRTLLRIKETVGLREISQRAVP